MLCPCYKYKSGLQKNRHARGKVENILLSHMQKLRKVCLMHAEVFERESKTNNKHTVAVLSQRPDFILLYYFFVFVF